MPPEPSFIHGEVEYEVDYIVDAFYVQSHRGRLRKGEQQYLVVWKGHDMAEATWEPEGNLTNAQDAIADFWARNSDE